MNVRTDPGTTASSGQTPYCGRFAPSPSGSLHLGSVIAAVASFAQARANHGTWHVRIDDLDAPRTVPGAADAILRELERLGLHWDGPVLFQHHRKERYEAAIRELLDASDAYMCACSRREVGHGPYPGTCRHGLPAGRTGRSVRLRTPDDDITISDLIQGQVVLNIAQTSGDFVIRRSDGLPAYHLATVIDDSDLGISEVVRGADLLEASAAQSSLYGALNRSRPRYAHVPAALSPNGLKLSKASSATATSEAPALTVLAKALDFLGHGAPTVSASKAGAELPWPEHAPAAGSVHELLGELVQRWRPGAIPRTRALPADKRADGPSPAHG
ncbi:MAG: glutamyl-Q tRNA(Asp) synthetase [Gammaproteobacteria bacterium]